MYAYEREHICASKICVLAKCMHRVCESENMCKWNMCVRVRIYV